MGKLVRDYIPSIILDKSVKGTKVNTKILNGDDFKNALRDKLQEEVTEYLESKTAEEEIEELADVLEVVLTLASIRGVSPDTLNRARELKRKLKGSFNSRIYLESVEKPSEEDK